MNFKFDENQLAVLEVVREFAQKELAPNIDQIQAEDYPPRDFFKKAGDAGIIGISMPEEYGGLGLSQETLMAAYVEIGKVAPGPVISITSSLSGLEIIRKHGTQEQKDKYLEAGIMGDVVASMAFTEAGTGSDPKQLKTTATEDGDYFIINGVKRFITNAAFHGPLVLYAKDADTGLCSAYIIDKFCEGYSLSTPWEKIGTKGSPVFDIFLDNVRIPKSNLIGKKGDGFRILLSESSVGKMCHAANCLAIMEACRDLAIKYAKEKLHRDKPITKFQAVQLKIARICERLESVRWMVYRCAQLADESTESEEFKAYASLVKAYAADTAPEVAVLAMNIMGPYGTMKEYNVERFLRDAVMEPHVEVVSDVQRIISANYYINQCQG